MVEDLYKFKDDFLALAKLLWPHVYLYDKQIQVIESVCKNSETVVTAGNELGKDFVSGLSAILFFLTRHPVRVVTTSVSDDHLRVLWGEIMRFVDDAIIPLRSTSGGPLICNHREIKKIINGKPEAISYLIGKVSEKGEGLQGHHADHTLFIIDEASGVDDVAYKMGSTWADKILIIGNPWPCENFFRKAVKGQIGTNDSGGDIWDERGGRYFRKVIKIEALDSPNVRYALGEISQGKKVSDYRVLPGVKTYADYQKNLALWDPIQIQVSLRGEFPDGAEVKLIPNEWLELSARRAAEEKPQSSTKAMGIDTAEGGDNTVYTITDRRRVIAQISHKTPNTAIIVNYALGLMRDYNVAPENVMFDRGGGGKQHADRMRAGGYRVQTVSFGESATDPKKHKRGLKTREYREEVDETRQTYKNRRAELYGMLREALNPESLDPLIIPKEILDKPRSDGKPSLRGQLTAIPLLYNQEGVLYLPSKKNITSKPKDPSLMDIIGCSPDEADSLAIANFVLRRKQFVAYAG